MSFYLEILADQRPFPVGLDAKNRTQYSCNYRAIGRAPIDTWEEDLIELMMVAGLVTSGSDVFIGRLPVLPDGDGPIVILIDTGGRPTDETHDLAKYEHLSIQIFVIGADPLAVRSKAMDIWRLLDGVINTTVDPPKELTTEGGFHLTTESGDRITTEG